MERESAKWRNGDVLVDLSAIEPLNLLVNLGVLMTGEDSLDVAEATLDSFAAATAELPVVQGVGNFAKDTMLYGKDVKESARDEAVNTLLSSVTPNLLRKVAQASDDTVRNAYTGQTFGEQVGDQLKLRVPGLRQSLPASLDNFGQERKYQGSPVGRALITLLSPVGVNYLQQTEVSAELGKLRQATGRTDMYPNKSPVKTLSADGVKYTLTAEERDAYQRTAGQVAYDTMAETMESRAYGLAPVGEKAEMMRAAVEYGQKAAREEYLRGIGVGYGDAALAKATEAMVAGISFSAYQAYVSDIAALSSDRDGDGKEIKGRTRKDKVVKVIDGTGLTAEQKDVLYLQTYSEKGLEETPWHGGKADFEKEERRKSGLPLYVGARAVYDLLGGLTGILGLLLLFDTFHCGKIGVKLLNRLRPHFACSFQGESQELFLLPNR